MCGIVGYIGKQEASPILVDGLQRLSYRGYDSAGIAVIDDQQCIQVKKAQGRLENLISLLDQTPVKGGIGIGHTRWATHGEPSDINAHPHTDVKNGIAVVHNGIIENHASLRRFLQSTGAVFVSQTDTEVVAHLLNHLYHGDMKQTLAQAMGMIEGSYALGVLCAKEPNVLYGAKNDSPLVIGAKDGAGFLASDIPALLGHTRDVIFMQDKEIAVLDAQGIRIFDAYGKSCDHAIFHVDWDLASAEKGGYAHYMLKEISEQPTALQNTFASRLSDMQKGVYDWFPMTKDEAVALPKISVVACGTASYAGQVGKYLIEKLARVPVVVDIASEYRYRDPIITKGEWCIAISQSGETADTLAAVREAKKRGAKVMAICNVVGSTLVREVGEEHTLYTYAGPEIAVASTKAYATQVMVLLLMAMTLAKLRGKIQPDIWQELIHELWQLPKKAESALETQAQLQRYVTKITKKKQVFFVGRGMDYALSMEAALKLKEVSYLFSEAYAAGELKHGPIALLQEGSVIIASITQPALLEKTLSNLHEVSARGAKVLAICTQSLASRVAEQVEWIITVPDASEWLSPLLAIIPLQLFAYSMAVERGCDVDQPRNLAKSVTVE